jgi:MFS family permease
MRWRLVPLLMAFVALAQFNRLSITVAGAEQIIRPGFISDQEMGPVYSAFLFLYTAFMMPGGWFIDRFGPRAAWMVVGFGSAAGVALTGLAGYAFSAPWALLAGLFAARSFMGLVSAPLHPAGARLVANWIPPTGVVLANGLVTCSALLGIASTYLVFGALIDAVGWPNAFLVTGGVTFLVSLVWTFAASDYPVGPASRAGLLHGPARLAGPTESAAIQVAPLHSPARLAGPTGITTSPAAPGPEPAAGFLRLLADPSLLCLTLSYGMVGYFQYLFFYWAQYYFKAELKLDNETSRLYTTILSLAMGAGMVLGGALADRVTARWGVRRLAVVPVAGLLLGAATTVCGAYAREVSLLLLSFAAAMLAVGLGEGSFWTAAVRIGGLRGGTAAGILNTGGNAIGLLAPIVTPFVSDSFGWTAALLLAAVACLAGAALWWGVTPGHSDETR